MLNLSRLQLLHELAVLGTISAVARAVNLTRPAVSQQLALLEQETGTVLFERSVRGARLTPQGRRLVASIRPVFEMMNNIEAELASSTRQVSGEIRIGGFASVASTIIPDAITYLMSRHEGLRINFQEMEPAEGFKAAAAKQVDIAVVDDLYDASTYAASLDFWPLYTDYFYAVLSSDHRLAAADKRTIELGDLAHERWSLNLAATTYHAFLSNACYAAGFEPEIACSNRNIATTLEFVRTGHFVSVLPYLAVCNIMSDPDFRVLRISPRLNRQIFATVAKGSARRPVIMATLAALEHVCPPMEQLGGR